MHHCLKPCFRTGCIAFVLPAKHAIWRFSSQKQGPTKLRWRISAPARLAGNAMMGKQPFQPALGPATGVMLRRRIRRPSAKCEVRSAKCEVRSAKCEFNDLQAIGVCDKQISWKAGKSRNPAFKTRSGFAKQEFAWLSQSIYYNRCAIQVIPANWPMQGHSFAPSSEWAVLYSCLVHFFPPPKILAQKNARSCHSHDYDKNGQKIPPWTQDH